MLDQIGPQRPAAHGQHDVIDGDASRLLDRQYPFHRPGLRRAPPRTSDRDVQDRPRGTERQRQLLFHQASAGEVERRRTESDSRTAELRQFAQQR